jgi:hypothetical protein
MYQATVVCAWPLAASQPNDTGRYQAGPATTLHVGCGPYLAQGLVQTTEPVHCGPYDISCCKHITEQPLGKYGLHIDSNE